MSCCDTWQLFLPVILVLFEVVCQCRQQTIFYVQIVQIAVGPQQSIVYLVGDFLVPYNVIFYAKVSKKTAPQILVVAMY